MVIHKTTKSHISERFSDREKVTNKEKIVLYKPRKSNIELCLESYSAMRYHNE